MQALQHPFLSEIQKKWKYVFSSLDDCNYVMMMPSVHGFQLCCSFLFTMVLNLLNISVIKTQLTNDVRDTGKGWCGSKTLQFEKD